MAWYALYKWFIRFSKRPYINQIKMYKSYLYSEWFNSLTDEEKNKVNESKRVQKEMEKRKLMQLEWTLLNMMQITSGNGFYFNPYNDYIL